MSFVGNPPRFDDRPQHPRTSVLFDSERHVGPTYILPPLPDFFRVLHTFTRMVQTGECIDITHGSRSPTFSICVAHVSMIGGYTSIGTRLRFPDTVVGVIHPSGLLLCHVNADTSADSAGTDAASDLIRAVDEILALWNVLRAIHAGPHSATAKAFHMPAYQGDQPVIEPHIPVDRMFRERGLQVYEFQYHGPSDREECVFTTWKHRPTPTLYTSTGCWLHFAPVV